MTESLKYVLSNASPTEMDKRYPSPTVWKNTKTDEFFILTGFLKGMAVWKELTTYEGSIVKLLLDKGSISPKESSISLTGELNHNQTIPIQVCAKSPSEASISIQIAKASHRGVKDSSRCGMLAVNQSQFDIQPETGLLSLRGDHSAKPVLKVKYKGKNYEANNSGVIDLDA